jgi:hypothetical protein
MSPAGDAADYCGNRGSDDLRAAGTLEERVVSDRAGQDAHRRSGQR